MEDALGSLRRSVHKTHLSDLAAERHLKDGPTELDGLLR